tara:strand:- start:3070 stop:3441 length:372 start_codon:yes stop_codon:yes gene_type:complete
MTVNVELLQKTLDTIKANPQHWKQERWHCGTSHCFAGFAELINRGLPIDTHEDVLRDEFDFFSYYHSDWNTSMHATELLGLDDEDAAWLFAGYNSLEDLEEMVAELIKSGTLQSKDSEDEDES